MSKSKETQETKAIRILAEALHDMLVTSTEDGLPVVRDRAAANALKRLRTHLSGWGLD